MLDPLLLEMMTVTQCADDRAMATLASILVPDERAHAARLRSTEARASFIAAHAALRLMLHDFAVVGCLSETFDTTSFGKPVLRDRRRGTMLRFSLSDGDGVAACVVGAGAELGIDVECRRSLRLMRSSDCDWLTRTEQERLAMLPQPVRDDQTLRLWVLKEAYAKALGLGLSLPFSRTAFELDPPPARLAGGHGHAPWHFAELQPTPAHRLALAVRPDRPRRFALRRRRLTAAELAQLAEAVLGLAMTTPPR